MEKTTILLSAFLLAAVSLFAQADKTYQAEDDRQRGYYDRPWQRYEAEMYKCETSGEILSPSFENAQLQSEATNQVAVTLQNQGDYIQWFCDSTANAMTVRFSLPDNATSSIDGTGTIGNLGLYVNGEKVKVYQSVRGGDAIALRDDIQLDSYWAWQYFTGRDNVAYEKLRGSILRMRFDEVILRPEVEIPAGSVFKLVKEDNNASPYTIDFVELEKVEPVTFESIEGEKVKYEGDGSDLQAFINDNGGKTIYIPEGKYNVPVRLYINDDNTKIQGAGIFYTELFFSAPLDDDNFKSRGFESASNRVGVDGMYVNTILNQRYYNRNVATQPGKGFNGSFGANSTISNVMVQHFECGAWIEDAQNLSVKHCRFRNNYADGTNLASACRNSTVEHCSYRNNGDDDMAAWSRVGLGVNVTYRHNTSELCWRAAGIGFFGGKQHKAHHCLIIEPIEIGIRIDASFGGTAFNNSGFIEIYENSVYKGGTKQNVWNNSYDGAIYVTLTGAQYDIPNISFKNIDVIDSKGNAISVNNYNNSNRKLKVCFENINIDGVGKHNVGNNGLYISSNVNGAVFIKNFDFKNVTGSNIMNRSAGSAKFVFKEETTELDPCDFAGFYTVTVKPSLAMMGTVTGTGTYVENAQVTLTANPKPGYAFEKWSDGDTNPTRTITVTQNANYTAIFYGLPFTITVMANEGEWGEVSGGDTYPCGTKVELTATPKIGYKFVKWDDGTTKNPYKITVTNKNQTYTAIFEVDTNGVEDTSGAEFRVYADGGSVYVENAKHDISLWDALGRKVTTAGANDGATVQMPVPSSGVYIVKCGSNAYKIMINK